MAKPKTAKIHFSYSYTSRDGCRVSKHFASQDTAARYFERVGATDVTYRGELEWNVERRWWAPREAA
jgi:hypothetical protein